MLQTIWTNAICLLIICATYITCLPDLSDLYGPYCANVGCCHGRRDECATPILGTLCYCDHFCENTRVFDCCPDYATFCLNQTTTTTTTTPKPEFIKGCTDPVTKRIIGLHKTVKLNCNLCTCESVSRLESELMCEQDDCLIEPELTSKINSLSPDFGWSASNYSEFWGHKLSEGIQLKLGTLQPQRFVMSMTPVRRKYNPHSLPREFDSHDAWPGKIASIQDQGWCGSSWAISTAAVASDRYAIISEGLEEVSLSAQNLLSCDIRGQQSCHGGYLDRAWLFVRKYGLVNEQCYPYTGKAEKCRIPVKGSLADSGCWSVRRERTSKYRVSPAYRLGNETDIMFEIMKSGPVQATMKVYHDFFTYKSGIYKHDHLTLSDKSGYHSVRIVGWGEDRSYRGIQKYWKVANSWGWQWGENGYFRIARGINECEIESFVLGVWPEIEKNYHLLDNNRLDSYI